MKLVPLSDRVVLKQLKAEENQIRNYLSKCCTGETTGSRSNRSWSWRSGRWQRSYHAGKRRTEGYLF